MKRDDLASVLLVSPDWKPDLSNTTCAGALRDEALRDEALRFAGTGKEAIGLLSIACIDLVVIDVSLSDMSPWDLIQMLRRAWPWQTWALVGTALSSEDEVRARSLGAAGVFDVLPVLPMLSEIARCARRRAGASARALPPRRATPRKHPAEMKQTIN